MHGSHEESDYRRWILAHWARGGRTTTICPAGFDRNEQRANGQRGSYIVVEDKTGLVYALTGVGNKLNGQLHHEVEVKGKIRSGTIKTGVNPNKAGSNPSDTEHGVDGVPLQVANVQTDVRTMSKSCKAADQQ